MDKMNHEIARKLVDEIALSLPPDMGLEAKINILEWIAAYINCKVVVELRREIKNPPESGRKLEGSDNA